MQNSKIPAAVNRFNNVPEVDLKCTLCNKDTTCDEPHLLFECIFFENERLTYLGRRRFRNINCIYFRDIMENRSAIRLSKLSKFMSIIMSVFRCNANYVLVHGHVHLKERGHQSHKQCWTLQFPAERTKTTKSTHALHNLVTTGQPPRGLAYIQETVWAYCLNLIKSMFGDCGKH